MDTKPKIRLGNGKKRGPQWLTAAICISDAEAHAYTYNGKKYVNLNINIYDAPNEYGKDVAITLNDFKKEESNSQQDRDSLLKKLAEVKVNLGNKMPNAPAPLQEEAYDLPF